MSRAAVRDIEIDYDRSGSGPDMIWGHGLSSNRRHEDACELFGWPRVREHCRLVRYDARGHGESATSPDAETFSWRSLAEDQLALADHLGIDHHIAGGASMGCGTALHAAVLAPDRIDRLLLAIPPTAWETRQERVAIWAQMAGLVETQGIEALLAASAAMPSPDPLVGRADQEAANQANMRATDPGRLAQVFRGAGHADLPARAVIATIAVPTLILAWTGDAGHPTGTAHELHGLIDGSELFVASTWDDLSTWTERAVEFISR